MRSCPGARETAPTKKGSAVIIATVAPEMGHNDDSAMTIDELIELAIEAREDLGSDAPVRIACQPAYPCAPRLRT